MEFHKLNNDDLLRLLEVNSVNIPLHKRLESDFVRNYPLKQINIDITASIIPKLNINKQHKNKKPVQTNKCLNQTVKKNLNQSIKKCVKKSVNKSVNKNIKKCLNQTLKKKRNQSIKRKIKKYQEKVLNQNINQKVDNYISNKEYKL